MHLHRRKRKIEVWIHDTQYFERLGGVSIGERLGDHSKFNGDAIRVGDVDRLDPAMIDLEHVVAEIIPALAFGIEVLDAVGAEGKVVGVRIVPKIDADIRPNVLAPRHL